jgi:chromosomal replication initiator protein
MVDDVQFIAGKQTAQEEFFHTFNAVHQAGGQIILTSDRPPSEISKLEDRLRSRFEGGLTVDVAQPDFELRVAIINIKASALHLQVPSNVAQLIASALTDTRAIEGFLRSLINEVSLYRVDISQELVAKKLKIDLSQTGGISAEKKTHKSRVTALDVLEAVSEYFEIKPMHLKGPKRDRPIARPRQLIMYICKTELNITLDDIGGILGGRDHTTILHGIEKISQELETNIQLKEAWLGIKNRLFT